MATVNIVKYSDLLRHFLYAPRMYILIESTEWSFMGLLNFEGSGLKW